MRVTARQREWMCVFPCKCVSVCECVSMCEWVSVCECAWVSECKWVSVCVCVCMNEWVRARNIATCRYFKTTQKYFFPPFTQGLIDCWLSFYIPPLPFAVGIWTQDFTLKIMTLNHIAIKTWTSYFAPSIIIVLFWVLQFSGLLSFFLLCGGNLITFE